MLALVVGAFLPMSWLRDLGARRTRQIAKALPFYLDIITLAIEAGFTGFALLVLWGGGF